MSPYLVVIYLNVTRNTDRIEMFLHKQLCWVSFYDTCDYPLDKAVKEHNGDAHKLTLAVISFPLFFCSVSMANECTSFQFILYVLQIQHAVFGAAQ